MAFKLLSLRDFILVVAKLAERSYSLRDANCGGHQRAPYDAVGPRVRSDAASSEEDLGRAALVHCPIAGRGLLERQLEIEDPPRVDRATLDQVEQLGEETAHRRRIAVQVDVAENSSPPASHVDSSPESCPTQDAGSTRRDEGPTWQPDDRPENTVR